MKHSDLPITKIEEDKLKFEPFVDRVVSGIKNYSQEECFIISIEGEWGIGKTSFMNLVSSKIKDDVEILRFSPWLISNIEQLISVFFGELIKSIKNISFKTKLKTDIIKDMKTLLSIIVPDQVSIGVTEGNKATWKLSKYFTPKDPHASQTLYEQKEKINSYLRDAKKRIVIVIDDIDRLMDNEVELVFRLVKGIADFDNVIYVLLFDRKIISNSLEKYKAEKGGRYLDKIIQYPLVIPKSHHTTILKLLTDKLDGLLDLPGNANYHFAEKDWHHVYQLLRRYIKNVRDVNKVFDTFSFEYEAISKDVNFVDFFVITLIRLNDHDLYELIKDKPYLFDVNLAYEDFEKYGTSNTSERREVIISKLTALHPKLDEHVKLLKIIFPLFNEYGGNSTVKRHERKSIADPHYFDNYFSMTVSADKLSFNEYNNYFEMLVEDIDTFTQKIQELETGKVEQFFEMFEDNSSSNMTDEIRTQVIKNLISLFPTTFPSARKDRDFRNDESFEDSTWFGYFSWIDLTAEEILKLDNPKEILSILDSKNIEIQHRCHLRNTIEKKYKKNNSNELDDELERYKEKHLKEISAITIETLLEFQFLDELLSCSSQLKVDMSTLADDFEKHLFKDKESFFKILEKFIYKHVSSLKKPKYPYSIQKSALEKLIDIDKVQNYINSLDKSNLNKTEQKLIQYWENED